MAAPASDDGDVRPRRHHEQRYQREPEPWRYAARGIERFRHQWIAEQARRRTPRRLLDVGCSLGELTTLLAELETQLVGVDVAPTAAITARRAVGHAPRTRAAVFFAAGSSTELPFADRSFDLVVASDGIFSWDLDHADRARALAELHRVTEAGGYVLLTEHMRYRRFASFFGEIEASPLRIVDRGHLHDRPWYQVESWFRAVQGWPGFRHARRSLGLARAFAVVGRLGGVRAARHAWALAQRAPDGPAATPP
jgi:SAM-dependent methyltransferase